MPRRTLAFALSLVLYTYAAPADASARPYRQTEQMRQEQRTLPAAQLNSLAVDGWGNVTVIGTATDRVTATATLRAWAGSTEEAEAMLASLRWYLDPAGGGKVRAGAHGPSQPDAVRYRGRRYGKQARVDLSLTVPVGFAVAVNTGEGDVVLRSLAGATVRADRGSVLMEQINGAADAETKAGAVTARGIGGRAWLISGNGKLSAVGVTGKLLARTGGGSIELRDLRSEAEARTKTGRISLINVGGAVTAEAGTGAIQATAIGGPCELRTTYGRISGRNLHGTQVVAHTTSGTIQLEQGQVTDTRYDLRSAQGPIEIGVDPRASLALELLSSFGRVETTLPVAVTNDSPRGRDPHRLLGSLNGGKSLLKAVSETGGILLRAAR